MKNISGSLIAILLVIGICSCNDKRLDIPPLNILTADQVFKSESAVTAYMASLYNALPMEDFNFYPVSNALSNNTDEAITSFGDERNGIGDGTWTPWWGYNNIRNVNDLLAKLPGSAVSDPVRKSLTGEAYFIRAYYYFAMVKRYGGVPIIREVQQFTGNNLADLQVKRDKEQDVYDFIASDLDSAALLLDEVNTKGRVTKYAALTLKSRAMLYAASSAAYGQVMLGGVLGIPPQEAGKYWQEAYDAAKAVMASGKFTLYNKNSDKTANFSALFLDEDNPEIILARYFSYPDKTHGYDCWYLPFGVRGPDGYSSRMCPTLESVEQFEYIDGSPGKLRLTDDAGKPVYYSDPADLFRDKDPRCLATVIVPFSSWQGSVIDVQAGIYDQGVKWEAGDYSAMYNVHTHKPDNANGTLHIAGLSGLGGNEKTQTGFYIRKYLDPSLDRSRATYSGSDQEWIDLRYGEVLLNYAEAAIELGRTADAETAVNEIRERAGIRLLDAAEVTLERVRHERLVELAFENQRWWDYRRWHLSDRLFNNTRFHQLKPYYDVEQKAYRFETGIAGRFPKTFEPRVYHERIDPAELAKNPNLIQNPNY
ncbi:RagB/SusD family nutrient uptake outer membrane protein [Compostibacter hankyongensis]|uniref:RagB/SusD family nutrient uptake outer membrane protein n=1 Tax=Compostibacter hankyongensis TaxID=1007089 RepID=A0ABP8FLA7_9BACT